MLATLSLSDVTLSPAFASETLNYTASVVNSVDTTYRYGDCAHRATARITSPADRPNTDGVTEAGHQVTLVAGCDHDHLAVTAGGATNVLQDRSPAERQPPTPP